MHGVLGPQGEQGPQVTRESELILPSAWFEVPIFLLALAAPTYSAPVASQAQPMHTIKAQTFVAHRVLANLA